jgi:hypothetical protein
LAFAERGPACYGGGAEVEQQRQLAVRLSIGGDIVVERQYAVPLQWQNTCSPIWTSCWPVIGSTRWASGRTVAGVVGRLRPVACVGTPPVVPGLVPGSSQTTAVH